MELTEMARQMIDFQKTGFDNAFSAVVVLQDQTEKMTSSLLDQAGWFPPQAQEAVNAWVNSYKKGRDDFKKFVDDNFEKMEAAVLEFDKTGQLSPFFSWTPQETSLPAPTKPKSKETAK
jgi:hypothetical protein